MEQIARTRDTKKAIRQRKKLRRRVVIQNRGLSLFTSVVVHYADRHDDLIVRRYGKRKPVSASSLRRIERLARERGGLDVYWVLPSSMAVGFTYDDGEVQADD